LLHHGRRPRIAVLFQVRPAVGITEGIAGRVDVVGDVLVGVVVGPVLVGDLRVLVLVDRLVVFGLLRLFLLLDRLFRRGRLLLGHRFFDRVLGRAGLVVDRLFRQLLGLGLDAELGQRAGLKLELELILFFERRGLG